MGKRLRNNRRFPLFASVRRRSRPEIISTRLMMARVQATSLAPLAQQGLSVPRTQGGRRRPVGWLGLSEPIPRDRHRRQCDLCPVAVQNFDPTDALRLLSGRLAEPLGAGQRELPGTPICVSVKTLGSSLSRPTCSETWASTLPPAADDWFCHPTLPTWADRDAAVHTPSGSTGRQSIPRASSGRSRDVPT
jgi:hypothetical protein